MNRRTRLVLFGVGLTTFVTTGMIMGGTGDMVTNVAWLGDIAPLSAKFQFFLRTSKPGAAP